MQYLDMQSGPVEMRVDLLPWQLRGLSYTASGYGKKIPTFKKVKATGADGRERWYRVYCMIYSNNGTCYICRKGFDFSENIVR